MTLHILYFGLLRERFGAEEMVETFAGANVAELLRHYRTRSPDLGSFWNSIAVAVNQQYADLPYFERGR